MTTSNCNQPYMVLLLEDDAVHATLFKHMLTDACDFSMRLEHVTTLSEARARLALNGFDVVLTDLTLPDSTGMGTLIGIRSAAPAVPVVVLTSSDDAKLAVEMLKHGAQDYLVKEDVRPKLLIRSLRFAIERQRVQTLESLNQQLEQTKATLTDTIGRLEQANEDLAQFTYFFSHDLQEPLRKLHFFSHQLEEALGRQINDRAKQDLLYIADAAERMRSLVQALLMLSKARQATLTCDAVDLQECVRQTLSCLAARIEETGAEFVCDPMPVVDGDATLLTLVYQNLIGNALKFIRDKKPLIRLTAERRKESWLLGVHDNGIGIEPEFLSQVFAPFQQAGPPGAYEGTGVGLSVCKKVIERHGGRIWVESTPGDGAHFIFELPVPVEHGSDSTGSPRKTELVPCESDGRIREPAFIPSDPEFHHEHPACLAN